MTTTQNHTSNAIVQKVWSFCHMLRDDGVSYGDYLEQITYLIFLKMAFEYSQLVGFLFGWGCVFNGCHRHCDVVVV